MIIQRYLISTILCRFLSIALLGSLLLASQQFVQYFHRIMSRGLPIDLVGHLILLQYPILLAIVLPLGLYLGLLLAYHHLALNHEMTVIQASGFGLWQILKVAFLLATVVGLVVAFIMLQLKPSLYQYQNNILVDASHFPLRQISPGQFVQLNHLGWVVYARAKDGHEGLKYIFLAKQPSGKSRFKSLERPATEEVMTADRVYQKIPDDDRFSKPVTLIFHKGKRYKGRPGGNAYEITDYLEYGMSLPSVLGQQASGTHFSNQVKYWTTQRLWSFKAHHPLVSAEIQWRLSVPISVFVLTLIAVSLGVVVKPQRQYAGLLWGILIYILYMNLLLMTRAWLKKGLIMPGLGMLWVHALFLCLGLFLLLRRPT